MDKVKEILGKLLKVYDEYDEHGVVGYAGIDKYAKELSKLFEPPDEELREKTAHIYLADRFGITVDGVTEYIKYEVIGQRDMEDALELADQVISLFGDIRGQKRKTKAKVITLCGSTRFTPEMLVKQWELTKQGNVVLSWCALPDGYFNGEDKTHVGDQEGVKDIVDKVHFRKIDLSDEVLVMNINGYIGESTTNEINYAKSVGVPVKYLEALKGDTE